MLYTKNHVFLLLFAIICTNNIARGSQRSCCLLMAIKNLQSADRAVSCAASNNKNENDGAAKSQLVEICEQELLEQFHCASTDDLALLQPSWFHYDLTSLQTQQTGLSKKCHNAKKKVAQLQKATLNAEILNAALAATTTMNPTQEKSHPAHRVYRRLEAAGKTAQKQLASISSSLEKVQTSILYVARSVTIQEDF